MKYWEKIKHNLIHYQSQLSSESRVSERGGKELPKGSIYIWEPIQQEQTSPA